MFRQTAPPSASCGEVQREVGPRGQGSAHCRARARARDTTGTTCVILVPGLTASSLSRVAAVSICAADSRRICPQQQPQPAHRQGIVALRAHRGHLQSRYKRGTATLVSAHSASAAGGKASRHTRGHARAHSPPRARVTQLKPPYVHIVQPSHPALPVNVETDEPRTKTTNQKKSGLINLSLRR